MKIRLIAFVFFGLIYSGSAFAQKDSLRRNEIGLHVFSLEYTGITGHKNIIVPISGLHVKHDFEGVSLRSGLSYYYYDYDHTGAEWYERRKTNDFSVSAGAEKEFGKRKFTFSAGADIIVEFQNNDQYAGGGFTGLYTYTRSKNVSINLATFIDLNYYFNKVFSLSYEASVETGFEKNQDLQYPGRQANWSFDDTPDLHLLNYISFNFHF